MTTSEIRVEWILETEQWFQRKVDRNSIATVRVLEDGSKIVEQVGNQMPPEP